MAQAETSNGANQSRTASREVRRRQLIEATIDSIAERGFSATTLSAVTKGARLSHGIVNFHFNNKETLFVETLGFLAQEHYDHWHGAMEAAGPDPSRQLAAVIKTDFERTISSPKKLAVWFAFWGQAKYRPAYLDIHNRYDKQRSGEFRRLCGLIVEDGGYEDIDLDSVTRSLEALVDGLWLGLLLYPKTIRREAALEDCFAFLARLFPKHFPGPSG